jgi:hypothetical protein
MRSRITALTTLIGVVLVAASGSLLALGTPTVDAPVVVVGSTDTPTTAPEPDQGRRDAGPGSTDAGTDRVEVSATPPATRPVPAADEVARRDPVRDVMRGAGRAPTTEPAQPIGELDDQRPVPAGFDFTARPQPAPSPGDHGGPGGLAVEPSCSHQCISRGVAYPRGFGAELIVETTVPATLFLSVVADLDDNGTYEDYDIESTPYPVRQHTWALDHLEPGRTYHVMASATDGDGHTASVWGELTTLSKRDVTVVLGDGQVIGGPDDIAATKWYLGLDGPLSDVTPGDQGILLYQDLPRHVAIDFWVTRSWNDDLCGAWVIEGAPPHGHDTGSCVTWSSTHIDAVDLDTIPPGATRWTETSVAVSLHPTTSAGDALPPDYGDPYAFTFEVPMTLHVTYS